MSPDTIHLAFVRGDEIVHAGSNDDGASFLEPLAISGNQQAARPSLATGQLSGDVYTGWHAIVDAGDAHIYTSSSTDEGESFGDVYRVDDDTKGLNQSLVSMAIDERSQRLYATWEDRRGGANVYFSYSDDVGASWVENINVGAGLSGDQFRPRAVVDIARNVYVACQDTTSGARIMFTRFNSEGTFDPPLEPSTEAGRAGVVADHPAVATDRYGAVYVAWQENRDGGEDVFFARAE